MLRLTHTYSSVSKKLNEIRIMGQQLKALGKAAEEVLREFDIGDMSTRREYTAQIKGIERFQEELVSIQKLEERLGTEKRKVQAYRERLERVQERIDKQKEMETVWRQRASRMSPHSPGGVEGVYTNLWNREAAIFVGVYFGLGDIVAFGYGE